MSALDKDFDADADFEPSGDAATDFATDPAVSEAPPAASAEATAAQPPEDGPKAPEPDGQPVRSAVPPTDVRAFVASLDAPEHYPEADVDAPSRLPPAARPCRAGP